MFSGIVEAIAEVADIVNEAPGRRLVIAAGEIALAAAIGDSIAINGCCLTVVRRDKTQLEFQAGPETLSRTNLGELMPKSLVNLERSLRLGDRLGGHLVTGHIDGIGMVDERIDQGEWSTFWFGIPRALARQMAAKGSVAVDGVSLTIVAAEADRFSVQLIPHTLSATTLGRLKAGDHVNIETDLLAKYVERQLGSGNEQAPMTNDQRPSA
jgi:riboflavin synthase